MASILEWFVTVAIRFGGGVETKEARGCKRDAFICMGMILYDTWSTYGCWWKKKQIFPDEEKITNTSCMNKTNLSKPILLIGTEYSKEDSHLPLWISALSERYWLWYHTILYHTIVPYLQWWMLRAVGFFQEHLTWNSLAHTSSKRMKNHLHTTKVSSFPTVISYFESSQAVPETGRSTTFYIHTNSYLYILRKSGFVWTINTV